jgi:hypothetical protein
MKPPRRIVRLRRPRKAPPAPKQRLSLFGGAPFMVIPYRADGAAMACPECDEPAPLIGQRLTCVFCNGVHYVDARGAIAEGEKLKAGGRA